MLDVTPIPLLSDNYAYLIRSAGKVAVIDPSEAAPVIEALGDDTLEFVFNTHHHWDHTDGNEALKARYGCPVIAPEGDRPRLALDRGVSDGDEVTVGKSTGVVLAVPGHTRHHVALWFREAGVVFTGDTLFLMGCGRLFEGTPAQMWSSLKRLRELPDATQVYCGHEYTEANLAFAKTLEPNSADIVERGRRVEAIRGKGQPTVPGSIGEEKKTNPFFRADVEEFQRASGFDGSPAEVFGATRRGKDNF